MNALLANVSNNQSRVDVYHEMPVTVKLMCANLILLLLIWLIVMFMFCLNQGRHDGAISASNGRETSVNDLTLWNRSTRV